MPSEHILEFLKTSVELFRDFPQDRLKGLVAVSRVSKFEPNEAIIKFGEEGHFLNILIEGEAAASRTDDSGDRLQVGVLQKGDIFGEIALMTGEKTSADVIGISCCKVLQIPQSFFLSELITYPPAVKLLSRTITDRLKSSASSEAARAVAAQAFRSSDDPYGFKLKSEEEAKILVINCGSSSLKYSFFDTENEENNVRGVVDRIGSAGTRNKVHCKTGELSLDLPPGDHSHALRAVIEALRSEEVGCIGSVDDITAVGHRVVHGGEQFECAEVINASVLSDLEKLIPLAPLHNPINIAGIREAVQILPGAPHVAVFDTSFHQTMPPYAYVYGLPYEYYEQDGIRRYGFHGMSHGYVGLRAAEFLKRPFNELGIISCHLGNGASVCAIDHGRSVDTSMGLTPVEGLIMGSRCGDIDPAVLLHLMREKGVGHEELSRIINEESGLKGLSGISNDMREIEAAAEAGDHRALLAFKTFCYKVRKYIGAYMAATGGLDVLIFTGGIGQGSAGVRSLACQGLGYMGIQVSEERNQNARGFDSVCDISTDEAPVRVLVVPTDEELMIARETLRALARHRITKVIRGQEKAPVPIEVSAHHVHLSQAHVEALFGPGRQLTPESELSQPGQFACAEKVTLIGPKGRVERVRVLGPTRKETQVEISMTEQFILGIHPPIRQSGDLQGSPGITLEGPAGQVVLSEGVICALRHIHMSPEEALRYGLRDKSLVRVNVKSERELLFGGVLVRVHPSFKLAMHIDTDEANAAEITTGMIGYIDGIQSKGPYH